MSPPHSLEPVAPAEAGFCPQGLNRLLGVLQSEIDRQRLPGAVALIARGGRLALFESLGRQSPQAQTAMARDSIFRIYSMTKPIVSVAVLMLMEEGRLLLGDPVSKYLSEFAGQKVAVLRDGRMALEPVQREATVQDLLRHTAGLTYEFLGDSAVQQQYVQVKIASRKRSNAEFARELAAIPLAHQPGSAWDYSRATDVLGVLIEALSGQTLGDFLQQRILGPLGMKDTAFSVPPRQQHRIAEAFDRDPDSGAPVKLLEVREPPRFESGGGGLVSTAMDYARFLQLMLGGGTLDGVRLLGRKTVELMTADHLGDIPRVCDLLSPGHGFGLGYAVRTHAGLAGVPGSVGLYYWGGIAGTSFFVDPKEELFALMMIQAPGQRDYFRPLFRDLVYAALD